MSGALLLLLGGCNTFDDPGDAGNSEVPGDDILVPPGAPFPVGRPIPGQGIAGMAVLPSAGSPGFPTGSGGTPAPGGAGGSPFPQAGTAAAGVSGGWQPIDAGSPDDDAGG